MMGSERLRRCAVSLRPFCRFFRCAFRARIERPSQISQGWEALLARMLPMMVSERIWFTSVVRQGFSRSSVGSRMARTPWTRRLLYAVSFSFCAATVSGSSGVGTGER